MEEKLTDAAHPSGTVVRTYVTDEAGAITKMTIPAGETGAGTHLVTWNGHGDALALWQINTSTGALTLANSYTYSTWGTPTTSTHNSIPDLGFRFLYVGQHDVQGDNAYGLGLLYMHARHYSPLSGRFLQPDPTAQEANLYAYAANSPITNVDPDGEWWFVAWFIFRVSVALMPLVRIAPHVQRALPAARALSQRIAGTHGLIHSFDRHAAQWFGRAVSLRSDLPRWQAVIEQGARSRQVFN